MIERLNYLPSKGKLQFSMHAVLHCLSMLTLQVSACSRLALSKVPHAVCSVRLCSPQNIQDIVCVCSSLPRGGATLQHLAALALAPLSARPSWNSATSLTTTGEQSDAPPC